MPRDDPSSETERASLVAAAIAALPPLQRETLILAEYEELTLDEMTPEDDPKLRELLNEWQLPDAPASLDARVLGAHKPWWSVLTSGSIRLPVPVAIVIAAALLVMAVALIRRQPAPPPPSAINLADFQPVRDLNVRIIRGHDETK